MRLIRCKLNNVRLHSELCIEFSPGITLIGGPNESGKSTLIDALHRLLFLKSSSVGASIEILRSHIHLGQPTVQLVFHANGDVWTLKKCFSGSSGQASLTSEEGGYKINGAEAEEKLASLLGQKETLGSRQANRFLSKRWSHLWVMQGRSGENLLSTQKENYDMELMIQQLEKKGGAAIQQSSNDQLVIKKIEDELAENYTSRGVKKNSPLWTNKQELDSAENKLQDRYGSTSHPGVTKMELEFLANLPCRMKKLLELGLQRIFPDISYEIIKEYSQNAVLDTIYSPTINLNGIFTLTSDNIATKNMIQRMIEEIMLELISSSKELGLDGSFFLHIAPNLGSEDGREKLKLATINDVGTTDIQFMIKGAVKEAGVMVLLNQHIKKKYGEFPFGQDFNVKNAPYEIDLILELCKRSIPKERMPLLIGVGDTVTSTKSQEDYKQLRGGSDRGFLTLVQEIGKSYMIPNRVVLVDSSSGEVDRPTLKTKDLNGITDPNDPLKFDVLVKDGPEEYIKWFESFANTK